MRGLRARSALLILPVAVASLVTCGTAGARPRPVPNLLPNLTCTNGTPIISSGSSFTLNADLPCGLEIDTNNIVVNLAGHTISNPGGSGDGLEIYGNNVTVENGTISGFTDGSAIRNASNDNNTFKNLTLTGDGTGLFDCGSYGTEVLGSTLSNDESGMTAFGATYQLVKGNTFSDDGSGYELGGTRNADFTNNVLNGNEYGVADMGESSNNAFTNNTGTGNGAGFSQFDIYNVTLTFNQASNVVQTIATPLGAPDLGSANDEFISNRLNGGGIGFALGGFGANGWGASYVSNNTVSNMDIAGILMAGTFNYQDPFSMDPTNPFGGTTEFGDGLPPNIANVIGSDVVGNTVTNTYGCGICSLMSPGSTVSNNTTTGNGVGMLSIIPWHDSITQNQFNQNYVVGMGLITDLGPMGEFPVSTVSNNVADSNGSQVQSLGEFGYWLADALGLGQSGPDPSLLATGMIADVTQYGGNNIASGNAQFNCLNITCSSGSTGVPTGPVSVGGGSHHPHGLAMRLHSLDKLLHGKIRVPKALVKLRKMKHVHFHVLKRHTARWHGRA